MNNYFILFIAGLQLCAAFLYFRAKEPLLGTIQLAAVTANISMFFVHTK